MNTLKRSILAGVLIAFAGVIYLGCSVSIVGAALFAVGLIAVILLRADLYTGKVGYLETKKDFLNLGVILAGNLIAAGSVGLIYRSAVKVIDVSSKFTSIPEFLFGSVLTGACIYLAVECNKKSGNLFTIILPVMAFILAGGDHCIADAFYFMASKQLTSEPFKLLGYLGLAIVGNAFGSLLIRCLQHEQQKQETIIIDVNK